MNNIAIIGRDCCGCGACIARCPQRCIRTDMNAEGFCEPVIDSEGCVDCGACLSVCPRHGEQNGSAPKAVYAAYAKDDGVLKRSSSGGLFSLAAKRSLNSGGSVYGAALDETDWSVSIRSAQNEDELSALCGSKYVQAKPMDVFEQIRGELSEGKPVLFAGCPCQVAALNGYVGESAGLTTIDIVCHGVPSPALFKAYIEWLKGKERADISGFRFRTKERGWGMTMGYSAGGRRVYRQSIFDRYLNPFLSCKDYRECCYKCPFANEFRQGDITIGDYWGVLREHPEFYSEKGVSALLVNTEKGETLLEDMKPDMEYISSTFEKAARNNENLTKPSSRPACRDGFYSGFNPSNPGDFVESRMKPHVEPKSAIKALIPWRLKRMIQSFARRIK